MKVAMFSRGNIRGEGGTATYLRSIIRLLPRHEFITFTTDDAEHPPLFKNVQQVLVPGSGVALDGYCLLARDQVQNALERDDIEVLHAHNPASAIELLRSRTSKPVLVTHHGSRLITSFTLDERARTLYDEYVELLPVAQAVIAHSPNLYPKMRGRGVRVHYIPLGTDILQVNQPDRILDLSLTPKGYNLFVGKLMPEKGVDVVIESYRKVDTKMPLVIAGNSHFNVDYATTVKKVATDDLRIRFLGEVHRSLKQELYTHAYTLINPLRVIGLPLVVLEAMGHGTCVINTDRSLCHEVIRKHALHFKHEDPTSLAQVLQRAMDNPSMVKELGKRSQEYVRNNHSWGVVADLYDQLYQQFSS